MGRHLQLIRSNIEVAPILAEVDAAPELWGGHPERTAPSDSPHRESLDVWLRFRPQDELTEPARYSEPHFAAWYPAMARLPSLRPVIFDLMRTMEAVYLGGCMLTRIPGGKRIYEHHDDGWHAQFMNTKLYVILRANEGCVNFCGDDAAVMKPGSVWRFENSVPHSVENNGNTDRVVAILTMRVEP